MPPLAGGPISFSFRPHLTAYRGRLISHAAGRGTAVYAASFIRRRKVVFDASLADNPRHLRFFLVHELFHFVWSRLGNPKRAEFARLLAQELAGGARGEMDESSALSKERLRKASPQRWRDYICESFCDTAACLYAGTRGNSSLAPRWHKGRQKWFQYLIQSQALFF